MFLMNEFLNSRLSKAILLMVVNISVAACAIHPSIPPLTKSESVYIKWSKKTLFEPPQLKIKTLKKYRERIFSETKKLFVNAGFEVTDNEKSADLIMFLGGSSHKVNEDFVFPLKQKALVTTGIVIVIAAAYRKQDSPNSYFLEGRGKAKSQKKSVSVGKNGLIGGRGTIAGSLITIEIVQRATEEAIKDYKERLHYLLKKAKK